MQLCFDFYMIEAKPKNLIGDRAYDSDPLDEELRSHAVGFRHICSIKCCMCISIHTYFLFTAYASYDEHRGKA